MKKLNRLQFNKIKIGKFSLADLSDLIRVNVENDEKNVEARKVKIYSTRALVVIAAILTVMNIVKHYTVMTIATSILTVGLVACAFFFEHKKVLVGNYLLMILIGALFSFFAIQGKNDGFAILWIMLIPPLASNLLNLRMGLIISTYFQLLIIAMFYTPWRFTMKGLYTDTFIMRFPVLYLACFIVSFIIVFEKEYYESKADILARSDVLTGLSNRRKFEEIFHNLDDNWDTAGDITVLEFDLNGLKHANDTIGHSAGDEIIVGAAECIEKAFTDALVVARIGGDEYSVITDKPADVVDKQIAAMYEHIKNWKGTLVDSLSISMGYASRINHPDLRIIELHALADQAMYDDKRKYYENSKTDRRRR